MKKQLIHTALLFIVVITGITLLCSKQIADNSKDTHYQQQLVDLNEIVNLSKQNDKESQTKLKQAIIDYKKSLYASKENSLELHNLKIVWILYFIFIVFLIFVFVYIYKTILRPFDKLVKYADEIANGNFDIDLPYERTNYFGKFTWAFDHMRREITKARACEKEAIDNNKTVIATLSHDIKTPIASIRAYAEALDANLDSGPEKRRKYITVIMNKCDEVTKLTNDLFLHSLSDLDKLNLNLVNENLEEVMQRIILERKIIDPCITFSGTMPKVTVAMDAKRFEQVIDNLINNAKKYAPGSNITISSEIDEYGVYIHVQDYGKGIPDEDIPFIFDKFYRGKNVGDRQGSGLGLYIVKYIMEQMKGSVSLKNTCEGLRVTLVLPYCS